MENDLISVVIPAFNGEKYIKECILSIKNQKVNTEIIVIDDLSKDNTVQIALSLGCKVIVNKEKQGQVKAKNLGIKLAKGNFWLTIDQDDKLKENSLEKLLIEFKKDKKAKIIMAKLKDFSLDKLNNRFCKKEAYYGILTGTTLFKKEVFNIIGFFNENIITGDVIDLTTRLNKHNIEIKKVDFITCDRRIHNNNFGRTNQKDEYKDYATLLRQRLKLKKSKI